MPVLATPDWWFNLRPSNTEPLLRLNVEAGLGGGTVNLIVVLAAQQRVVDPGRVGAAGIELGGRVRRRPVAGHAAYERRSVAVTSNIHPSGFDQIMPKTLATATVDRLLHHAHLVLTKGDSHRPAEALAGKGVVPLS